MLFISVLLFLLIIILVQYFSSCFIFHLIMAFDNVKTARPINFVNILSQNVILIILNISHAIQTKFLRLFYGIHFFLNCQQFCHQQAQCDS